MMMMPGAKSPTQHNRTPAAASAAAQSPQQINQGSVHPALSKGPSAAQGSTFMKPQRSTHTLQVRVCQQQQHHRSTHQ